MVMSSVHFRGHRVPSVSPDGQAAEGELDVDFREPSLSSDPGHRETTEGAMLRGPGWMGGPVWGPVSPWGLSLSPHSPSFAELCLPSRTDFFSQKACLMSRGHLGP